MAGTSVVTVLACDLVESTALMSRVGDDAADAIRREVFAQWRATIEREGGTVVKTIGDAVMAVFDSSAVQAVAAAVGLHESIDDESVRMRVGIATGEAAEEDGDWFGTPVVEAFRLCARAHPDEILLSAVARHVVGSRGNYEFADLGTLTLKGLPARVHTYALVREGAPAPRRRRTRPRWVVPVTVGVAFVALAIGVAAVATRDTGAEKASVAALDTHRLGYTPLLDARACSPEEATGDPTVTCWLLAVPEDRSKPGGRRVRLPVVKAPAANSQAPPEISFEGQTGAVAGVDLRSVADQYQLTPRGTARAVPSLDCKEANDDRRRRLALAARAASALLYEQLDTCVARFTGQGIDLTKYGPNDLADDVRDLAIAAQLPQVDLRVYGAGITPALAMIRRSPSLVRGIVFTSAESPLGRDQFSSARDADAALVAYEKRCRADPTCAAVAPNFAPTLDALRTEWTTRPRRVTVSAPDGKPAAVLVDGDRAAEALWHAMHDDTVYGVVPSVVASLNADLVGSYIALRHLTTDPLTDPLEPDVRSVVWRCKRSGDDSLTELEGEQRAFSRWQTLVDIEGFTRCGRWKIAADRDLAVPVVSNLPALVAYGALEPEAPQIERLRGTLTGAQFVRLGGHSWADALSWPSCVSEVRRLFVLQPERAIDTEACGRSATPVQYVLTPPPVP